LLYIESHVEVEIKVTSRRRRRKLGLPLLQLCLWKPHLCLDSIAA
jgi:hypothetical protein